MNDDDLTLQDIAQIAADRHGGGGRAMERVAKRHGLDLTFTTFDRILKGKYRSDPTPATLDALTELSGVPRDKVYRAAEKPMRLAPFADQLPPDADLLTPKQRDAVIAVVRQFAQANKDLYAATQEEVVGNAGYPAPKIVPDLRPEQKDDHETLTSAARRTDKKVASKRSKSATEDPGGDPTEP